MQPGLGQAADDPAWKQQRDSSLGRLGKLVHEQCFAYYSRRAKEVADRMAQARGQGPVVPELAARLAFKVWAVLVRWHAAAWCMELSAVRRALNWHGLRPCCSPVGAQRLLHVGAKGARHHAIG